MKEKSTNIAIIIFSFTVLILLSLIADTYKRSVYNRQQEQISRIKEKNNELKEICQDLERDINELSSRSIIVPIATQKLGLYFPMPNNIYMISITDKEKLQCTFVELNVRNGQL